MKSNWILSDCISFVCIRISAFKHVSAPWSMEGLNNNRFPLLNSLMKNILGVFLEQTHTVER